MLQIADVQDLSKYSDEDIKAFVKKAQQELKDREIKPFHPFTTKNGSRLVWSGKYVFQMMDGKVMYANAHEVSAAYNRELFWTPWTPSWTRDGNGVGDHQAACDRAIAMLYMDHHNHPQY